MINDPSRLGQKQRLALAAVSGAGQRYCFGNGADRPREEALAQLRESTTDPVVLGFAMGAALATLEIDGYASYRRLADLYLLAGADQDIATAVLERHREDYRVHGHR